MRVVFFGSPEFAIPILETLATSAGFEIALVVTQGVKAPSPIELSARRLDLPIYKPETLRDAASRQPLVEANADLFVVAAFGLIFRQRTLDIPRLGSINVHPSLLPKYRGASPIAAAILAGDEITGVSLMVMDAGIDTGAVVSVESVVVASDDTTESLGARLSEVAAAQAVRDIPRWAAGELQAEPQSNVDASLTRTLTKADGQIDWRRPAQEIERQVRAMWPWPRAWTTLDGTLFQVHHARVTNEVTAGVEPGAVLLSKRRIVVATGNGVLELLTVEPASRRAMTASSYLNGRRGPIERFGDSVEVAQLPPLIVPISEQRMGNDQN